MAPIKKKVHINVDLGEGYGNYRCGNDEELIPMIDHANVACGGHAGDPLIMQNTTFKASDEESITLHITKLHRAMSAEEIDRIKMSPEELTAMTRYQIGALKAFLDAEGMPLNHVKPHGVLYGMMYRDRATCHAVYAGIPAGVPVFGLAGTIHEEVAAELGLPFVAELYGDVKYNADCTLVIDRKKKAWDPVDVRAHISTQVSSSSVTAVTGEEVSLPLGDHDISLCCHSDSPGAVEIVRAAREIVDEFNKRNGY